MNTPLSRRGFVRQGALLCAGAVALLAGANVRAQTDPAADVRILNVALAREHEGINAYQLGALGGLLQKPVLDKQLAKVAARLAADETAHWSILANALGKPLPAPFFGA